MTNIMNEKYRTELVNRLGKLMQRICWQIHEVYRSKTTSNYYDILCQVIRIWHMKHI